MDKLKVTNKRKGVTKYVFENQVPTWQKRGYEVVTDAPTKPRVAAKAKAE